MKLKIKKGDTVEVITGNDKGKSGRVMMVMPKEMKILVEGINIRKKHARPSQDNPKGGIKEMEMPIHYSNVMLIDSDKKATRIGIRYEEKGNRTTKVRYAKTNDIAL
jgi:large subunit ribosomal protein L24